MKINVRDKLGKYLIIGNTTALLAFSLATAFTDNSYAVDREVIEQIRSKVNQSAQMKKDIESKKEPAAPAISSEKEKNAAPANTNAPEKESAKLVKTAEVEVTKKEPVVSEPAAAITGVGTEPVNVSKAASENAIGLLESINIALEKNRALKSTEKNISLADLKLQEADTKYLPKVNYQGTVTRTDHKSQMSIAGMSFVVADNVLPEHKFTYEQALYTSKKVEYAKAMVEKYKDAAVFSVDAAKVNLVYNVKKSFYDLLLVKEFVKVAEESLDLIKAHVQTVKNRFNAGTSSKFDLLRVEVQEANIKPNLIKANSNLIIAKNAFNSILARPIFEELELKGSLKKPSLPVIDLDSAVRTALLTRPEIKAADSDLKASETALKLAQAQNKPDVALVGNYSQAKGKSAPLNNFDETWNITLAAKVPIYDANATHLSIATAKETIEQKKINFNDLLENIKLEVKVAYQELTQAGELIVASEKNVEQANEALSIAKVSYDNGLNTNLEIMDAQLALTQAKTNYYQSLHDYMVAFAKLEKAMGIARIAEE
ncbi:MAG: TolC family protein [Candidatus Wallbacteria bacterium]